MFVSLCKLQELILENLKGTCTYGTIGYSQCGGTSLRGIVKTGCKSPRRVGLEVTCTQALGRVAPHQ